MNNTQTPFGGYYTAQNIERLTARANVFAKRANRALEAGDLDSVAYYTNCELAARKQAGQLQDID